MGGREAPRKKKEKKPGRKKPCKFCMDHIVVIDYKDEKRLRKFMTDRGKIAARRITGTCARHQRQLARSPPASGGRCPTSPRTGSWSRPTAG